MLYKLQGAPIRRSQFSLLFVVAIYASSDLYLLIKCLASKDKITREIEDELARIQRGVRSDSFVIIELRRLKTNY